jgi:hypothetical protein
VGTEGKLVIPVDPYHPKQFVKKSEYREEYTKKKSKPEIPIRIHPGSHPDSLEIPNCAPFPNSTYQDSYLPYAEKPPLQMKNQENIGMPASRMLGTSNYRDHFKWKSQRGVKREQPLKPDNNLAVGNQGIIFNGKSCY